MDQPEGFNSPAQAPRPDFPPMTEPMIRAMLGIGPWARFFSILGIIFTALGTMAGLMLIVLGVVGFALPRDMGGAKMNLSV